MIRNEDANKAVRIGWLKGEDGIGFEFGDGVGMCSETRNLKQ